MEVSRIFSLPSRWSALRAVRTKPTARRALDYDHGGLGTASNTIDSKLVKETSNNLLTDGYLRLFADHSTGGDP